MDRLDLHVIAQQADVLAPRGRASPASPAQREPAVISVTISTLVPGNEVQEISPEVALDLADALAQAAAVIRSA